MNCDTDDGLLLQSRSLVTLKELVRGILARHGSMIDGESFFFWCVFDLVYTVNNTGMSCSDMAQQEPQTISDIAEHVFSDGVINWGRILVLTAFGVSLYRHLHNKGKCGKHVADDLAGYLMVHHMAWFDHNCWVSRNLPIDKINACCTSGANYHNQLTESIVYFFLIKCLGYLLGSTSSTRTTKQTKFPTAWSHRWSYALCLVICVVIFQIKTF